MQNYYNNEKKIFLQLQLEQLFGSLCYLTHLKKCFHMLSRCVLLENRISAFPHHIIYCFHDIKHFLKRKKNVQFRVHNILCFDSENIISMISILEKKIRLLFSDWTASRVYWIPLGILAHWFGFHYLFSTCRWMFLI